MDELIADQIEWLINNCSNTSRLGRQLVILVGFLADGELPEEIARQTAVLSRLVVLQDMFDALVSALNTISRMTLMTRPEKTDTVISPPSQQTSLMGQIEATRRDIAACDPVNYAQLIAWSVAQAKQRKILSARPRR